jgi:hypothetical protein
VARARRLRVAILQRGSDLGVGHRRKLLDPVLEDRFLWTPRFDALAPAVGSAPGRLVQKERLAGILPVHENDEVLAERLDPIGRGLRIGELQTGG